ncbi:MAG TPA: hypothetical protein VGX37_10180 [Allosphingosinicella sp.]|nr:hypothetical protein [Allosphingosinicella sp.]
MILIALALNASELPVQPMTVEVVRDPITDGIRASATLREDGNRLVVSCQPHEYHGPRITFHSRRWLQRGYFFSGQRPVTFRFDNQRPARMFWEIDDRSATLDGDRRVAYFLNGLFVSERLVIRTRDVEKRRFDMIFHLRDVRPAVEQALRACSGAPAAG